MIDYHDLTVVTPMGIEASAVRRECPHLRVVESGIALANADASTFGDTVIVCGLAGGLRRDLPTGTILIPREIERPNGERVACDASLQRALFDAAQRLGFEAIDAPMITSSTLIGGEDRPRLAARGFGGVDMEAGLLTARRVAVVRAILDTPQRELSPAWIHPARALMNPLLWPQAVWLGRNAGPNMRNAARILGEAVTQGA